MVAVPLTFQSTTGSNNGQGSPFWNNNSLDGPNMNGGYFLTGTNASAGMTSDYLGAGGGFGNYLSTGSSGLDASTNFSFIQTALAVRITLLYTNGSANYSAYGTEIGLYNVQNPSQKQVLFAHGTLYNPAAFSGGVYNNNVSPQSPFSVNTWANYGIYANTCGFNPNGSIYCDTYYSNTALDQSSESARQHFALFQNAQNPQTYFVGFEDTRGLNATEGYGDFNDAMFRIETTTDFRTEVIPTPEPATFSIIGLGLVGLGLLRRSRLKK
ncbi:MAG: sorting protein [Bryobacterales bacterium]|nr:sorting protein [Bryobacterales bacterium]